MRTLREWRLARLMSTRALAGKASISNKTLIDVEYGRRRPTYATMAKLSNALGVEASEVTEFVAALDDLGKDAA